MSALLRPGARDSLTSCLELERIDTVFEPVKDAGHQEDGMPPPLITTKEAATRLARAIASDISLYNEQKIIGGIENDNLFDALKDEIEEGRELYRSRVAPDLFASTNFFDRAVVDIILRSKAHIKSKIW